MAPRRKAKSDPPQVLSASYLEGAKNKNDLLKRLKNITEQLSDEEVEPHSPHYPGLSSLATSLVWVDEDDDTSYIYLNHKDKDVRLHSVLACMELFYIYAPEPPWNEDEIIEIFQQMIRQLGNLATCIPNDNASLLNQYEAYFRILEQLSEVKIGVVLVDLVRTEQAPQALETLCELIKTILTCVHVDHPPEVGQHAESAVAACVEEFEGNIPNAVLDELLLPVGGGPVTYVIDPKSKENPPAQIQQTNPSYLVAAKVLRKTEDKVSTPIANLLNGIFSGDPKTLESTSLSAEDLTESPPSSGKKKKKGGKDTTPSPTLVFTKEVDAGDVYSIAYELHRITPMILTTVIGTVASDLTNTDVDKRWQATKLLGRLFAARTSDIAKRFRPCFRDWLRRSYDPEGAIREMMIRSLTNFLSSQYNQTDLCSDVSEALSVIIKLDKITEIRVYAIHQVCELAHSATSDDAQSDESTRRKTHPISAVSAELLNAVGARVSSKFKTERKDAITGLARIYYKHYVTKKLQLVQEGGEDVDIDEILDVLSKENMDKALEEKFSWIPQKVFESVFFSDEHDPDLRSRIFQIVDDIMLGTVKKEGAMLSPTSRAVGLAMILQTLQTKESANKWMCTLFSHRGNLQRSLASYLDARSKAKECESGSAEAFTADADAMEKLEKMAALCAPPAAAGKSSSEVGDLETVLRKLHAAKDKHIFRILSTIATPTHSPSARIRALDELPKRTKSLGNATSSWVRSMARRCAMGSLINSESIDTCIILSQECFEAGDSEAASHFLRCVKVATSIFPALGGTKEGFKNLAEFFDLCRTTVMTSAMKKEMEKYGIVTMISDILAKAAGSSRTGKKEKDTESVDTLRKQLHRTCTREGTPEQARNAVYAIAAMMNPRSKPITDLSVRARKENTEFEPILKALVNPSRLSIPDDDANSKTKDRIISVLTAVTAIAECAPYAFNASGEGNKLGWGERAIKFALDAALLGRNTRLDTSRDDGDDSEDSDIDEESPEKSGRKKANKKKKSGVSVHCQMMSEAIELLVTHIRSTVVSSRRKAKHAELDPPSSTHIAEVFSTLAKILEDGGVPPSSVNGRYCKTSQDRAALRRSAAINLLRLCDSGLKLEDTYLTSRMWHVLSNVLLDKDASVRDSVAEELSFMLSGIGKYRHGGIGSAPSMRFIAFVTLCAESRKAGKVKTAMMQCISSLRGSIATCQAQVRAMGKAAEKNFENNLKMKLMPEYCVPYALHLLAFRHETASAAGTLAGEDDSDAEMEADELAQSEEASEKRLKKRLKFLFDPLIQSLGERADNISFLLRMVDQIGKFSPVDVMKRSSKISSLETSLDDDDSVTEADNEEKEAAARMKIIYQFAREVLLSHVKKDFNLTVYPGSIQVPAALYSRNQSSPATAPIRYDSDDSFERPAKKRPKKSISHYVKKNQDLESDDDKSVDDKSEDEKSVHDKSDDDESVDGKSGDDKSVDEGVPMMEPAEEEMEDDFGNGADDTFSPITEKEEQSNFSPAKEEHPSDNFAKGLDNISPIAKDAVSPLAEPPSSSPAKKRAPRSKKVSTKKRKSSDIDIFEDDVTSPATETASSPKLSSKRRSSRTTPKASASAKKKKSSVKSKATPVSVTKKAMISITNSQSSSSSASSTKKRGRKKETQKDADDSFDFPDSPPKKGGKKKAAGRTKKKSPPARKTSAKKAKISAPSPSTTSEASSRASRDRASRALRRSAVA
eukprot:CAMPEP_0201719072 /NCGR_PEP_ID=MMETSP0593-20130828/4392_1 /ASSEMBLY_ACC=CAM_ASM_000672 /TAXON_ID=267983 /ORGANISM="Skeletonema japonicum, Strain CCMP2506" /LENGTH=1727 /DNA_ID=CAMNT_0048209463 /DNA_START=14 /DNA_END=5197 /DNA_ORIENTATION=+